MVGTSLSLSPLLSPGLSALAGFSLNFRQCLKEVSELTEESWVPIFRVLLLFRGVKVTKDCELPEGDRGTPTEQG